MLEVILRVVPGIAAVIVAMLAAAATVKKPPKKYHLYWYLAFGFLGVMALAATVASEIMLHQQGRELEQRETDRDREFGRRDADRKAELSRVQGSMDALLKLVPGLASGNLDLAVEAQRKLAQVQTQLSVMTSHRHLTGDQRTALIEVFPQPTKPCPDQFGSFLSFTNTTETEDYAREFLPVLNAAHWNVIEYPFLHHSKKATNDEYRVAIAVSPADLSRFKIVESRAVTVGLKCRVVADPEKQEGCIDFQVDDLY